MNGLIIDTSLKSGYVAAFCNEKVSYALLDNSEFSTMSMLVPTVKKVLGEIGVDVKELCAVAAVVGPGSFTGIRIGVSFVNAVAYALGVPSYSFTAFDVMRGTAKMDGAFCVDAGHDASYTATFNGDAVNYENSDNAAIGKGAVFQAYVMENLPQNAVEIFRAAATCGEQSPFYCKYLTPFYMKKSQAERAKENE